MTPTGASTDTVTVTYDGAGRKTVETTPTGSSTTRTVTTTWDGDLDRVVATEDSGTGLRSTTRYDTNGWPVE